ncbi:Putative ubiquinone biosynthesis monooxygenase [Ancistrocladus abbreviatus]
MHNLLLKRLNFDAHRWKALNRYFCNARDVKVPISDFCGHKEDHEVENPPTDDVQGYDVAIVGGGMVGMALACSLASNPLTEKLSVAIIDSNPALTRGVRINKDEPPDPRVSTITPTTISLLKDIGAWKYIEQHRHASFSKMQVWDYTGLGYTSYNAGDVNKEALGYVVENKVLHRSLLLRLQDTDFEKTIFPSRLTSMTCHSTVGSSGSGCSYADGQLAKLELDDGRNLFAKLVVGADGGKSRVRELAGFSTTGWNYLQNAIICTVEHKEDSHCAWQRFLPGGPIALLPMGDNFSNIVWTMSPKESSDYKAMNEDDFVKAVNHALDYGFGPHPQSSRGIGDMLSWLSKDLMSTDESFELPPKITRLVSQRMVFPLSLVHTNSYTAKRVVLIGDAAHTVHPLAGQGVNMGFGDVVALLRVISEGVALGADIGEVSLLRKYEAERKTANTLMTAILDGFQRAYSVDFGLVNVLRAVAFHGAQYISPLKKNIIRYASGEKAIPFL